MRTLNHNALEAVRQAIGTIPGAAYWDDCERIIVAYIRALPQHDGVTTEAINALAEIKESFRREGLGVVSPYWLPRIEAIEAALQPANGG